MLESLGRYKIVGELGRGGCGVVYRAEDPAIGRTVAIKTIQADADSPESEALRSRFRREARSAGSLSHPNIVIIHEFSETTDPMFIAMEFIDGQTLAKSMSGVQLPVDFIVKVLGSAADALDYAHAHNIVHRDVKPANFLIDQRGHLKIADFGVAKLLDSADGQTNLTSTGTVVGTAQYMSPEQISEERITGRSDQFSLAVIAYEMLTGVKPFQGNSWATFMHAIMMTEPPPVTKYCEGLTEKVSAVIEKALSKTPEKRYATCREFCDALEKELHAGGFSGRTPPTGAQPAGLGTGQFATPAVAATDRFGRPPAQPVKKASLLRYVAIGVWAALTIFAVWIGFRLKTAREKAHVATERPSVEQPAVAVPDHASEPLPSQPAPSPEAQAEPVPPASEPTAKPPAKEARREMAKAEPPRVAASSAIANQQNPVSPPAVTAQKTPVQAVASPPAPVISTPPASSVAPPVAPPPLPKRAEDDQPKVAAEEQSRRAAEDQARRLADLQAKAAEEKVVSARNADLQAIARALLDYQAAYRHKDPAALQTIWPSIPKAILEGTRDSFREASEVSTDLHSLGDPEISGGAATVICDRNLRQVIRKKVLQASSRVKIVLVRGSAGWVIQSIEAISR